MKKLFALLLSVALCLSLCSCGNSNIKQAETLWAEAQTSLNSGDYDTALAAFNQIPALIDGESDTEQFADLDAYIYACNYYKLADYLQQDNSIVEYQASDSFTVFAKADASSILISFEGLSKPWYSQSEGRMIANFHNCSAVIPAPDKSAPSIPSKLDWSYTCSDSINGYAPVAKASGTFNPMECFILTEKSNGDVSIKTNIDFSERTGDTEHVDANAMQYFRNLMNQLHFYLETTELDISMSDLSLFDVVAAYDELKAE